VEGWRDADRPGDFEPDLDGLSVGFFFSPGAAFFGGGVEPAMALIPLVA
jgi:hypothetical protein